jgi:hypothetical protein
VAGVGGKQGERPGREAAVSNYSIYEIVINKIGGLMKIIFNIFIIGLLSFASAAQSQTDATPIWHKVANINAGKMLDKNDKSIAQAKVLIESLSKRYHAPADDLSGMVLYAYKQVKSLDDGRTTFFDLLEIADYCGTERKNLTRDSLAKDLVLYQMNRNEGTSHTLTVIRVCGLFN